MDIVSQKIRSRMMANIGSKNTKPELAVRKHLHSLGYRFRLHKTIAGTKPDLVLTKYKTCIFVHGCFWHRHRNCKLASVPKTRREFWAAKFKANVDRDAESQRRLQALGWNCLVIWECSIRDKSYMELDFKSIFAE
jgi:DNA mismatch endonuclease (patch repair protein)